MQLTAPAAFARAQSSVAYSNASTLNGCVTLMPRPPRARNASTAAAKPPTGASIAS